MNSLFGWMAVYDMYKRRSFGARIKRKLPYLALVVIALVGLFLALLLVSGIAEPEPEQCLFTIVRPGDITMHWYVDLGKPIGYHHVMYLCGPSMHRVSMLPEGATLLNPLAEQGYFGEMN